jgi:hypothetical protein
MARVFFAFIAALTIILVNSAPISLALSAGDGTAVAQTEQPKDEGTGAAAKVTGEVDVDVNDGEGAWYLSPTWIVIGVLAVGVLVAIIVAATRGGGTTVIKD